MNIIAEDPTTVDSVWNGSTLTEVAILNPLHDSDYGSHQFDSHDHKNNLSAIGTYRGA